MRIGSIGLMGLSLPHFFGWQQQAKAAGAPAARLAGLGAVASTLFALAV
jgi:hypothetical protein